MLVVLFLVACWCVRGVWQSCVGAIGVVEVCGFAVGVGASISVFVPNIVASSCKEVSLHPWEVWFYFRVFWMARINVVAILVSSSICVSTGISP